MDDEAESVGRGGVERMALEVVAGNDVLAPPQCEHIRNDATRGSPGRDRGAHEAKKHVKTPREQGLALRLLAHNVPERSAGTGATVAKPNEADGGMAAGEGIGVELLHVQVRADKADGHAARGEAARELRARERVTGRWAREQDDVKRAPTGEHQVRRRHSGGSREGTSQQAASHATKARRTSPPPRAGTGDRIIVANSARAKAKAPKVEAHVCVPAPFPGSIAG